MYKETAICLVIIIFVITLEVITQNYTKQSIEDLSSKLDELKKEINEDELDKLENSIKYIKEDLESRYSKLAFYINHEDIEKFGVEIAEIQSDIEIEEYKRSIEKIDLCIYMLKNIQDKNSMKLVNIF